MELETEAIALGTLYKLLEMRLELQMFTLTGPEGAPERTLEIWLKLLFDVIEKVSVYQTRSLLYYKIWLISRGLYARVECVKKTVETQTDTCFHYYAVLHDRPLKEFTWGNTTVRCLQDVINLAYLADHHCCMLNIDALRGILINLEDFIGSICGQYTVLPPELCHQQQNCLLCDFNRSPRVGNIHSCNHTTHVIENGGDNSGRDTIIFDDKKQPTDFWSLFSTLDVDDSKDDKNKIPQRTGKLDLLDFFTCEDQNMLMWVGCYGVSSWDTINDTCEVAKRHAIAYNSDNDTRRELKTDPHVTNLIELDRQYVLREATQRHREFIHTKAQKIKQRIDDAMIVLKRDLISVLAPSLMSDSIFDMLYSLKRSCANRLEFLAKVKEMEMWHPDDDDIAAVIAELCHVSLESKNMVELEESTFELIISPRTWRLANREDVLPCRYAVFANLEFSHNEEIIRGQLKHMCQYRDPRQRQPWNVGEALSHIERYDDPTLIRYAFYARANLLFYALKRIRGFDIKVLRPETCFKQTTTKYVVYLNPADGIPAALISDNCNIYADDPSHIAVYLMQNGEL